MKQVHFSRKRRQLKALAERYHSLLSKQTDDISILPGKLVFKIKNLLKELSGVFSRADLIKVLGTAAIFSGIAMANPVSAQSFGPPQSNPFGLVSTYQIAAPAFADLDGDGDMDLLVGEYGGSMQYFQNTGTASNPQFATPVMNPFGLVSVQADAPALPAFTDLDGDGDMDLLVGEYEGGMVYFENTGSVTSPQFATPQTNPFGLVSTYYLSAPAFADFDSDGDMDLLVGELYGAMQYFENTGSETTPQFAAPQTNPFGLVSTSFFALPSIADVDGDGDMDILVGEYYGALNYFQNTGTASNPQFASPLLNPFGLVSSYELALPTFADLDDDGDMDLLVGEYYGAMNYFQNLSSVGINPISVGPDFTLFPNPATDVIRIKTDEMPARIEIFDASGKCVSVNENSVSAYNITKLKKGSYFMKLSNDKGESTTRPFQKY